jgi:exodeoxyribonuclease VII small subunit
MSKQTKSPAETQIEEAEPVNFEKAMAELEQLVTQMEDGDLSLNDSLQAFERGIKLTRQCQHALSQAELKVKTLTASNTLEELAEEDA